MNDDDGLKPKSEPTARPRALAAEYLTVLLAELADQGWQRLTVRTKATSDQSVHAFATPSGQIQLQLTLFGGSEESRHRLEIAALHPEAWGAADRPAWAIRAEQPAEIVIRTLAFAAITGPMTAHLERALPRKGWSQLKVYEHGAHLTETRYMDDRGRSVSFFPADPAIAEPAAWLVVRPGMDGHPAAIHATAAVPQHLIVVAALVS